MPLCSEMRHVASRSSFSASIEPIAKLVMNMARAVFFFHVSSQSAFAHVVAGDLEKGKETVYGATRSGAIDGAQPLRRGAGDAPDGAPYH